MVGVEMWVKVYSPNVQAIEVVKRVEKRARRAKLFYMRCVTLFPTPIPYPGVFFFCLFFYFETVLETAENEWADEAGCAGNRNTIRVVWRKRLRSI